MIVTRGAVAMCPSNGEKYVARCNGRTGDDVGNHGCVDAGAQL